MLTELTEFIFQTDEKRMNWFREDYPYAQVRCPDEFSWTVRNVRTGDELTTTIRIVNSGEHSYFTNIGTIGITFPMPDKYDAANICLNDRCHTHIFCGENTSYVMCLRMGGEAPHLGTVLTEGSLSGYSVERDIARISNDRGCFLLHPSPKEFAPGEEMKITWKLFPHNGKEDFYRKLRAYPSIIGVEAKHFLLFAGEQEKIQIVPAFPAKEVTVNGTAIRKDGNGEWQYVFKADRLGEQILRIEADGVQTVCRLFVQQPIEELLENRCRFIVKNQQYHGQIRELQGAYLGFDNEEKHLVYTPENDFNAGRERTGMGVLLARFLQMNGTFAHKEEEDSLKAYRAYYLRELVDPDTGTVCNDTGRDNRYFRLYNYPWAATFFVECYHLWKNPQDLKIAQKIIYQFYELGGYRFYPIEMPIVSVCRALEDAGWTEDAEAMKQIFRKHADNLLAAGKNYPASEVNFEQSIIAPAADVILQVYELSGEEKYLDGARLQMEMLDLFNGEQPDYHLHEAAIRHWDGYWFGKRRLYGDTFPHYWSAETGRVFRRYTALTGDMRYLEKAENSLRGVLSMFYPDGTATCAYVFPYSVNGERAGFADPYANDQDWGLCSFIEKTR